MIVKIKDEDYERKFPTKKIEYYLDDRLKNKTDDKIIKALDKNDKDFFAIVDGAEGTGKSWFAIQWGKYADPTLDLSRIVFTPDEFKNAVFKAKRKQCIIYDEAFTGMGSRSSLSSINRYLVSLAMQIRQKNLFVILVLPSVFLLDKYFVMFRSKVLVHIYENKGIRGYFRVYNSKKIKQLVVLGKQTFSYVKGVYTKFKGRFYGKFGLGDELEEAYRKKKAKALTEAEHNPMSAGQVKYMEQRDLSLYLLRKYSKLTYQELSNLILDYQIDLSYQQIRNICAKFGDKDEIIKEKQDKRDEIKKKKKKNEVLVVNGAEKKGMGDFAVEIDDYLEENDEETPDKDEF
jgi:hypothetical protein